jgi:hypothetical protein
VGRRRRHEAACVWTPFARDRCRAGTGAQLSEIGQIISDSFGAWSGVSAANSCSDDTENNLDGVNTVCFNQSSMGFSSGVLAFTRVITANAPGVSVGVSGPAAFAGQILDADTLFRNDGQATFATPAAPAASPGAYDLESLLAHDIGHWFGFDHSAVWRALMFPFAPPPGQFLGDRPKALAPDGPLADDDRAVLGRIRFGNFRSPRGCRRHGQRTGGRRDVGRLELRSGESCAAVRRRVRYREAAGGTQLHDLRRAVGGACCAWRFQRRAE